tara:strand:- start:318 stop:1097 length:780 start_codon:yes stop_codon:yes gene_type:complete
VAKKISRKELLKKDDAFIAAAGQSVQWAEHNKSKIIATSVTGLVLMLATWGTFEYLQARDQNASEAFQEAMQVMEAEVIAEADRTEDAQGTLFDSEKDKWAAALTAFKKVQEVGGSSGVGALARFYLGSLEAKLDNKDVALEIFGALAESLSVSDELYFLAKERQAYLFEDLGKQDQALAAFAALARDKNHFYADYAGLHQARLLQTKGEAEQARNVLERLQKDFPGSSLKEDIEVRLKKLTTQTGDVPQVPAAEANTN